VNLIWEYEHFDRCAASTQPLRQVHHLTEGNIPIVIALNQEHWRPPSRDGRIRRGFERQLTGFGFIRCLAAPLYRETGPIVHPMKVDAGSEYVGVASKSQRGQVPSPYDPPHNAILLPSTNGRLFKHFTAAKISLYSEALRHPASGASRNERPYIVPSR
jgi:hypothetical protein